MKKKLFSGCKSRNEQMQQKQKYVTKVFMLMIVAVMLSFVGKVDHALATEKFTIKQVKGIYGNEYIIYFTSDSLPKENYTVPETNYAFLSADNGTNWIKTNIHYDANKDYYIIQPQVEDPNTKSGYSNWLTPSTIYQMYVVNQNGEQSETIEVATGIKYDTYKDDAGAKKYEVTVKDWTKNTCTITWDAVDGANGYILKTYDEDDNTFKITTTNTTSYTIQGETLPSWKEDEREMLFFLEPVSVYPCFQFNDLCFESEWEMGSITPVFQPSKPVVTWSWSSGLRELIHFSIKTNYNSDNTAAYKIQCYDLKTGKKVSAKRTSGYYITDIKKDRIYKFRVKQTYTNENNGNIYYTQWSDYIYALPVPKFDAVRNADGNIKVTWDKVNKVTGYDIYVKKEGTKKKVKVASVGKNKTSYTIKKVNGASISKNSYYEVFLISKKKIGKKNHVSRNDYGRSVY